MPHDKLLYTDGYRFQSSNQIAIQLDVNPNVYFNTDFISITLNGVLIIRKGYAWNGANKPAINTKNSVRATEIHDALYQAIRMGFLPKSYRDEADREMRKALREDGMSYLRARWWYRGVRVGGSPSASPKNRKKVLSCP